MQHVSLRERRHDLDWVRIIAFALLILYHIGMYYVTWDYHVNSPHASPAIELLMRLSSPWRLSLLFLVSGVATGYLLERQGPHNFLGRRSFRLLVPLVFGMLVIVPPQSYLEVVEKVSYEGSYLEFLCLYLTAYQGFCRGDDCLILPTWNHLWFVAYLWVYTTLLYIGVRAVPGGARRLRGLAERGLTGWHVLIWPILYLALVRVLLAAKFPSTHALIDDWYSHAVYAPVFVLGFALAGTQAPWDAIERARWYALGLAVLAWAYLSAYFGFYAGAGEPPPDGLIQFGRVVYAAEQWLSIVAVLGFARRHLNRDNAARRYLTLAIFPVYILHQTVIVVAAHALKPAHLDPVTEGLLLVLVTAALCFLGYEAIRRVRPLRPLFGLTLADKPAPGSARPAPVVSRNGRVSQSPTQTMAEIREK